MECFNPRRADHIPNSIKRIYSVLGIDPRLLNLDFKVTCPEAVLVGGVNEVGGVFERPDASVMNPFSPLTPELCRY